MSRYLQEIRAISCFPMKTGRILLAIASKCMIRANIHLQALKKDTQVVREPTRSRFIGTLCTPMTNLSINFLILRHMTRIWDSAMSRSYAHFWSLYSWDHSSRHELDPVSRIPVANGQFLRSDCTGNIAIVRKLRAVPYCVLMLWGDDAFIHTQRMSP